MKKFFYTFLLCTVALSLVGCLGDDDKDATVDLEYQTKLLLADMQGSYSGRLITSNNDTLQNMTWKVDTILHAWTLPDTLFAKCITGHDELREALSHDTETEIHAPIIYAQKVNNDASTRAFYLYPKIVQKTLEYGGKSHKVQFVFTHYPYSFGYHNVNTSMIFQIVLAYIYEDDVPLTDFRQTSFIWNNTVTNEK